MGRFHIWKIKDWITKRQFRVISRLSSGEIDKVRRKKDGLPFQTNRVYPASLNHHIKILSFDEDLVHLTIQITTLKRPSWQTDLSVHYPDEWNPIDVEIDKIFFDETGYFRVDI
jgi:hypothetical protein